MGKWATRLGSFSLITCAFKDITLMNMLAIMIVDLRLIIINILDV